MAVGYARAMRYDLLAIDLDGTLLGPGAVLSPANAEAVDRARRSGLRVVVCTGRGLAECRPFLDALGQRDPVIVAGGAVTADPVSGATIDRFVMDPGLVGRVAGVLLEAGHAVLVLKDAGATGYDYLVLTGDDGIEPDPVTLWWFERMRVRVRSVRTLDDDPDPGDTVRVGLCTDARVSDALAGVLRARFGDEIILHSFKAVVSSRTDADGGRTVNILEAFDPAGGKWAALDRLARRWGVPRARIAAVGDEINDLEMIRSAGLGVAMGNAIGAVRDAADRVAPPHDADGVAWAIDRILEGAW